VDAIRGRRERVVLRIAFPDGWFEQQVSALLAWDGRGVVELIDHDPRGAQLLERPDPGRPLALVRDDDLAMGAAAEVAKKIWIDDPGGIDAVGAEVAAWAASMDDRNEALGTVVDDDLIEQAREALVIRSGEERERVLLHGNLRLGSILSSKRQPWLATDPQPLVGEREFDVTALLTDGADPLAADVDAGRERIARRFDLLSGRLRCDRERLRGWAIGITIDDALWSFEAGDRDAGIARVAVARMLQDLIP
jgi:streptomycin 6-kinase